MRHQSKTLSKSSHIAHGFFTRQGGVSEGIYASLNCGPGSDDDPQAVAENRRRVMEELSAEEASLCTLHQIHSAKVTAVRVPWSDCLRPQADAMVTATPNILIGILTADCGPVLFADEQANVIGAAHAGWKGAVGGILEETIAAMCDLGATREHIHATLGPTIAQESYEVGAEFYETLLADVADNERFFVPSPHPSPRGEEAFPGEPTGESHGKAGEGKYRFDLPAYITHRLTQCGLAGVENLAMDTYDNETDFFSYRRSTHRGEADYGRQISAIMLKEKT